MKPAWDKLMDAFADSKTALVGDVDCTAAGKPLCDSNGVQGFPTIKWGDPSALEDYSGGRDFDALEKFANENLKPMCSPANIDLCDDDKKAEIEKFQAMSSDDLDAAIKEKEAALDASLKAADDKVAKTLIEARKQRDLDASTAAKAASDANLKANQDRVAWEKDQLERGENQDRNKFRNQETAAKTSEIQGKHDERERANGRLLKALAS